MIMDRNIAEDDKISVGLKKSKTEPSISVLHIVQIGTLKMSLVRIMWDTGLTHTAGGLWFLGA